MSENGSGQPSPIEPLRWGILGTARIATKLSRAILRSGGEIVHVGSRKESRGQHWVAEHVPESAQRQSVAVGSYETVINDPRVTAVYIPLPPSLHAEWTIRAAEAGKHVLCEKPLSINGRSAVDMLRACEQHSVQLLDGTMWLHHQRTGEMRSVIADGGIGDVHRWTGAFTVNARDMRDDNIRFQSDLGGGSLLDLGWYCVRAANWAFGAVPNRVFATARWSGGIDRRCTAIMWYDNDRMASFDCGFDTAMRKWFEVAGSGGSVICDDFVSPWNPAQARFWVHDDHGKASVRAISDCDQEVEMLRYFCSRIQVGGSCMDLTRQAVAAQRVLDALLLSARTEQPANVTDEDSTDDNL